MEKKEKKEEKFIYKKKSGGAGFRTPDLPHAKRTLYHWATPPRGDRNRKFRRVVNFPKTEVYVATSAQPFTV